MKTLFVTNVGSHMWSMQTPESDLDLMLVYQEDTRNILEGRGIEKTRPDRSFMQHGTLIDQKEQEIGHLVNKLIDGNVNAIWTVCTPLVMHDHPYLHELREITVENLSKASYASIRGMTYSQIADIEKRKDVMPPFKSARTAMRTCHFGIFLLEQNRLDFNVKHLMGMNPEEKDARHSLDMLENAYESSKLPERPDEKPFREFLFKIRMEQLTGG